MIDVNCELPYSIWRSVPAKIVFFVQFADMLMRGEETHKA